MSDLVKKVATVPPPQAALEAIAARDRDMLRKLDEAGLLFAAKPSRKPDDFGAKTTAFDSYEKLSSGQTILVQTKLADLSSATWPGGGKSFRHPMSEELVKEGARELETRGNFEGIAVCSLLELRRANAAEQLTNVDTQDAYSYTEKAAILKLREFEGSYHGHIKERADCDDYVACYDLTSVPPSGKEDSNNPGIYDPGVKKGGILGIGGRTDRLTAYEALEHLMVNKPIVLRSKDKRYVISNMEELSVLEQLG